ncbi:hypothetical protein ANCDUO_14601, partial [Ancylostoma duodenale]
MAKSPDGQHPTLLVPPVLKNRSPVLYQVVSTNWGTGVVLEAKDFFTVGPDRRDLHCIIPDFFGINIQTGLRGYDKSMVSVKDFVWVYDVKPTRQAMENPENTLAMSRVPRTTSLENNSVFFFRAAEFAFVTPHQQEEPIYGIVLSITKRQDQVAAFRAAFEGAPEAVTVTQFICDFPLSDVQEDDFVLADSRYNVSCSMRFSEPPVSLEARDHLCQCTRAFRVWRVTGTCPRTGAVVDAVYGRTPLSCDNSDDQPRFTSWTGEHVCNIKGRAVALTHDQRDAVALGVSELPVVAIQAAFGTGKTVVGSLIAAHLAIERRIPVIVTATTNAAVAQFTETILSLDDYPDLAVVRYVSDTAVAENLTRTPVDLNEILKNLGDNFADELEEKDKQLCQDFKEGREHLEEHLHHPERALAMTEDDKEEYFISESFVSNLQKMVDLMFALLKPSIICATTASLLNTTAAPEGIFARHVSNFQVLIGDEASQIPEIALVAMATRLPRVRHVYIGEMHQLEPHAKCSRSSNSAHLGARSVMSVLCEAGAVPVAPLITTFRTHPALIELPNRVAYDGALVSGLNTEQRRMLLEVIRFPSPTTPFMFIDVRGFSVRAA